MTLIDFNLSDIQMEILKVMCARESSSEWTNDALSRLMNRKVMKIIVFNKGSGSSEVHKRSVKSMQFNVLGPNLGSMLKKGFLLSRLNPNSLPGQRTLWRLGPMSDLYKEECEV